MMKIWSLTADDGSGVSTALYLTEGQAWGALANIWFPECDSEDEYRGNDVVNHAALMAAIEDSPAAAVVWFDRYQEENRHGDGSFAFIEAHEHPWVFWPEWISTLERLPSCEQMVLVQDAYGGQETAFLNKHGVWVGSESVTFWAPLMPA